VDQAILSISGFERDLNIVN